MTEQQATDIASMGDVAQKAEYKQQAYESNKRLKTSLQAVSSDRGKHTTCSCFAVHSASTVLACCMVMTLDCGFLAIFVTGDILSIPAVTLS